MMDGGYFYDEATGGAVRVQLEREGEKFRMPIQLAYRDPAYAEPFVVPLHPDTFTTDLASIPRMFAWLIPGIGTHLPAVLLHDGLVRGRNEGRTHQCPEVALRSTDRNLTASCETPCGRWARRSSAAG